jgi:hypothetical protein
MFGSGYENCPEFGIRKMEVCLINFNKGEDDEGCKKFCNILKWSATV